MISVLESTCEWKSNLQALKVRIHEREGPIWRFRRVRKCCHLTLWSNVDFSITHHLPQQPFFVRAEMEVQIEFPRPRHRCSNYASKCFMWISGISKILHCDIVEMLFPPDGHGCAHPLGGGRLGAEGLRGEGEDYFLSFVGIYFFSPLNISYH